MTTQTNQLGWFPTSEATNNTLITDEIHNCISVPNLFIPQEVIAPQRSSSLQKICSPRSGKQIESSLTSSSSLRLNESNLKLSSLQEFKTKTRQRRQLVRSYSSLAPHRPAPIQSANKLGDHNSLSAPLPSENVLVVPKTAMRMHETSHLSSLITACKTNDMALFEELLDLNVDVNEADEDGCTPLMHACSAGSTTMVKKLLNAGANIGAHDKLENGVLSYASSADIRMMITNRLPGASAIFSKSNSISEAEVPACLNSPAPSGDLSKISFQLLQAIQHGKADEAQRLLQVNVHISHAICNDPDMHGNTALHVVANQGNESVLRSLLRYCEKLNQPNNEGSTPLHLAIIAGNLQCVNLLIDAGADVFYANLANGLTPLHLTAAEANACITQALMDAGAIDMNPDFSGATPLHIAARCGYPATLKLLLAPEQAKAAVNVRMQGGLTALMCAVRARAYVAASLLIDAGADVNLADDEGNTPIMCTVVMASLPLLQLLHSHGADVNIANQRGETPLSCSVACSLNDFTRVLVVAGARLADCQIIQDMPLSSANSRHSSTGNMSTSFRSLCPQISPFADKYLPLGSQQGSLEASGSTLGLSRSGRLSRHGALTASKEICIITESDDQPCVTPSSSLPRRSVSLTLAGSDLSVGISVRGKRKQCFGLNADSWTSPFDDGQSHVTFSTNSSPNNSAREHVPSLLRPPRRSSLLLRTATISVADVLVDYDDTLKPGCIQKGPYSEIVRFKDPDETDQLTFQKDIDPDSTWGQALAACFCMQSSVHPNEEDSTARQSGCVIS